METLMEIDFNMSLILSNIAMFALGAITMYLMVSWEKPPSSKSLTTPSMEPGQPHPMVKRPIRVYVDGCWDVMHSGHYNALRQAKSLGDVLVVGVHSDAEIERNKREPVMNNEQRMAAVKSCKWADEVVFDVPYAATPKLLDKLKCDFVAHGDDIPIAANGHSAYHEVMDRLRIFRRTPGVSTTHLIQRLLDAAKKNQETNSKEEGSIGSLNSDLYDHRQSDAQKTLHIESTSSWSSFLASSSRISAFSNDRTPTKDDVVVYIDGVFDLFHIGHIAALRAAKQLGTFLFVGLYDDETVRSRKGPYFPLMNLQERVLNVLSCKYVDDILIGAPWKITKQVLLSLNVKHVVITKNTMFAADEMDRYAIPQEMGILKELKTETDYTTDDLMQSIVEQQEKLEDQNRNRVQKAKQYVDGLEYVPETISSK